MARPDPESVIGPPGPLPRLAERSADSIADALHAQFDRGEPLDIDMAFELGRRAGLAEYSGPDADRFYGPPPPGARYS